MTTPGYTYASGTLMTSPISVSEFEALKQTVLFGEEDEQYLKLAGKVLSDQTDQVLEVWYGFVAAHPHLLAYFSTPQGEPIPNYLQRVRQRFAHWIVDTCTRPYDQNWLNYQYEIGLRHLTKKNQTDQVQSVNFIEMRYMTAFIYPITATIRPFLANKGHNAEEVEKMYQAWFKSVVLQVTLWLYPYTPKVW